MTLTATNLFCGAGGSSRGAETVGVEVTIAANHWQTAIDVHQIHHPNARHDCADISQVDPRRYPSTDLLLGGPECTNHTGAKGVSRKRQDASLFDDFDPQAEKSRATMWDVVRFAEFHRYSACVIENVVEATKWVLFPSWVSAMQNLGYTLKVVSINAAHVGVHSWRDRIQIVCTLDGIRPDLTLRLPIDCPRCEKVTNAEQAWKNGRTVGKFRQQYHYACTTCGTKVEPHVNPAQEIIDWSIPAPLIRDRKKALVANTMARIEHGLRTYGPDSFMVRNYGGNLKPANAHMPLTGPAATITTQDHHALVIPSRGGGSTAKPVTHPLATITAGGNHHGLLVPYYRTGKATPLTQPAPTITTRDRCGVLAPLAIDPGDCGYRMLGDGEIGRGMGFPDGYLPAELTKEAKTAMFGNADPPPVAAWTVGRVAQALAA